MTAWQRWHDDYRNPGSDLSRRLSVVQERIRAWADGADEGPLRLISICAGQAHDVVGALGPHRRREDVEGVLVELDEANVVVARRRLQEARLTGITAVTGDAAEPDAYARAVPADLILVCGVFGNIRDGDVRQTIEALPTLAAAGATVIWTRHRRAPDLTDDIRRWFDQSGFAEVDFSSPGPGRYAVGTHRFAGQPQAFRAGTPLPFTFTR